MCVCVCARARCGRVSVCYLLLGLGLDRVVSANYNTQLYRLFDCRLVDLRESDKTDKQEGFFLWIVCFLVIGDCL